MIILSGKCFCVSANGFVWSPLKYMGKGKNEIFFFFFLITRVNDFFFKCFKWICELACLIRFSHWIIQSRYTVLQTFIELLWLAMFIGSEILKHFASKHFILLVMFVSLEPCFRFPNSGWFMWYQIKESLRSLTS